MSKSKPAWLVFVTKRLKAIQDGCYTDGRVVIESPFTGDRRTNRAYLKACLRDSLARGEFPFASHAVFTLALDDTDPVQRELGIRAGLEWAKGADATAVYADLGITAGMARGIQAANEAGRQVTVRHLRGRWRVATGRGTPGRTFAIPTADGQPVAGPDSAVGRRRIFRATDGPAVKRLKV